MSEDLSNLNIRQLYTPIQPSVVKTQSISYQEFLPEIELQNYIYCYWELKTLQELDKPFVYRVVSDGCIDILFELNNIDENFAMGFYNKYTEVELKKEFRYVGIRFLPTKFPILFNVPASKLSNVCEPLINVLPNVSKFISSCFTNTQPTREIIDKLDKYFINVIKEKKELPFDNRFHKAMLIILKNNGVLNIEKDIDVGISPRQLRRLFKFYVGNTAKTFCKMVQFQNILKAKPSKQSLQKDKLFYEMGYFDQSHFIKDFKNFYGVTPSQTYNR